ncbi:acyl-CoA dehydrogenase family protein [Rhodococcus sp. G-MC3]|uniref:acyl-CoA dehydrogenase family protein n=1 Tax=Rhodococcus sp. G-MC3 TaxID=3046209 RepID=UPI0024BB8DE6|nr:acyl-CoA dehydrogenase family protein [Rhodococcus sp. G-MC3]MDJ0396397.1 acyl-CoA dehydrogenase family protein [Rhodococcus sp. G-MC3]
MIYSQFTVRTMNRGAGNRSPNKGFTMTLLDTAAPSTTPETEQHRLVAAARDLGPLLLSNAAQAETDRRVPQANIDALRDAGLFDITKPARFGGSQEGFRTFLEVVLELGRCCGSTAWVATLSNVTSYTLGFFPEAVQQEVLGADPHIATCGVVTPTATSVRAEGGYTVTGRWGFASASSHASWANVGIPITTESGEALGPGMALIPMSDLTIEDTWYVAGMSGSGSNTLVADEVFVPDSHVLSVIDAMQGITPTEFQDERLYQSALVPVLALVLVGPVLGMAEGAYDTVMATLKKNKPISYSFYERSIDAPSTQLAMAEARSLIDQAELLAFRSADEVDAAAAEGRQMSVLERARCRMDAAHAAKRCREAVELLLNVGGAGSFAQVNPLQRIWRDLETGSRHAFISLNINEEIYGRALLGIEEQVSPFI